MASVVSIMNLKGGVGKSTLAMLISEFLVFEFSKRVLLVDMDAQANLSYCMVPAKSIRELAESQRTTYHLLKKALEGGEIHLLDFVPKGDLVVSNIARGSLPRPMYPGTLHIVVSSPEVAQLDEDLISLWEHGKPIPRGLRSCLRDAIEAVRADYDYIILDCPPGLTLFSSTALLASDYFVSPVIPEPLSIRGVDLVKMRAAGLKRDVGAKVSFGGVILNVVKHYRNTHRRVSEYLYSEEGRALYEPFRWWVPDSELVRKLGEFDPEMGGGRESPNSPKFANIQQKYGASTGRLTNPDPDTASLSRSDEEGERYRLEDRLRRLVVEFQTRFGEAEHEQEGLQDHN